MENIITPIPPSQVKAESVAQAQLDKTHAPKLVQGQIEAIEVGVHADQKAVEQAIHDIRHHLDYANRRLEYSFHESSNQFVVRIEDKSTGKVIREVPNTEFLDLVSRLQDMVGFVINKSA